MCDFSSYQLQYVLSERFIDPNIVCADLHVCPKYDQNPLSPEEQDKIFFRKFKSILDSLVHNIPVKVEQTVTSGKVMKKGYDVPDWVMERTAKKDLNSKPFQSDTIKLLHFGDVHLDHYYQQVSHLVSLIVDI